MNWWHFLLWKVFWIPHTHTHPPYIYPVLNHDHLAQAQKKHADFSFCLHFHGLKLQLQISGMLLEKDHLNLKEKNLGKWVEVTFQCLLLPKQARQGWQQIWNHPSCSQRLGTCPVPPASTILYPWQWAVQQLTFQCIKKGITLFHTWCNNCLVGTYSQ